MKKLISYYKKISKYKNLEFELYKTKISFYNYFSFITKILSDDSIILYFKLNILGDIFDFDLMFNKHTDHAGFKFNLTLFGFNLSFIIYDCRHWDDENNNWLN